MSDFLNILSFAFSVTGPIFVVLMLGIALARVGLITDAFVDAGTRLVFNVTLPSLLFISISKTNLGQTAIIALIGYGLAGTLAVYLLLEVLARYLVRPGTDRGVVVQGAFRSNMAIVGLAYCVNAYGEAGLAAASLYLGFVTILLNILSVITLNRSLDRHGSWRDTLRSIVRNPLIISILLALPVAWTHLSLPAVLLKTGEYFAQMTLPLALLCTGASLSLAHLRQEPRNALYATLGKLLLVPALLTGGGFFLGFRGMDLGILFLLSSSPTAAASYVMARAMGGNAGLAANIIVLTTLGSILITSLGIMLLRGQGWM
ncbi:MAG: AEC family transporter [Thiobacillus sp.]|nr:AEC family transporter [Thiobacillus sp.]